MPYPGLGRVLVGGGAQMENREIHSEGQVDQLT
jgi:hypothetical protein